MRKVAYQSIQTTIFSYIGVVLGYVNVLWLYPFALTTTELGTFRTIQDLGLLLVPFAQLGLGHGITRYFPKLDTQQPALLTFSLFISLLGFGVVAGLFFGLKAQVIQLFCCQLPRGHRLFGYHASSCLIFGVEQHPRCFCPLLRQSGHSYLF
jgi:O-antigen/teichoic acid export membrane protein